MHVLPLILHHALWLFSALAWSRDSPPPPGETLPLRLETGLSETLSFEAIAEVAVSDGRIARARQIDEKTLLVTARKPGTCFLRVWTQPGHALAYRVQVFPPGRLSQSAGSDLGVVHVSLQVLEVSSKARQQLGVHWPQMLDMRGAAVVGTDYPTGNFGLRVNLAQGWLRQLMERGWARILSQPELSVVLGEQAVFTSGGEVPFPVLTDSYGRLQQSIQWKQYGLTFKIRPESSDGFVIRSDLQVEISELSEANGMQNVPSVLKRTLTTKVHSKEGQTLFLSGLVRDIQSQTSGEVPLLGQFPILGIFFRERNKSEENAEVVLAMTLGLHTKALVEAQRARFENLKERTADD